MIVAIAGTGVIGTSWAAHFLRHGHDVVATDPAPGAEERLRAGVAEIGAPPDRLSFTADAGEAAAAADFVQENGPERVDVKHALVAALDAAARRDVVLASSSSGLLPTEIARGAARHPERVLVGHPFHPPHLVPLVEVVPGERTSEAAVEAALEHLGPPAQEWWRDLGSVTLTPELVTTLVAGVDAELDGTDPADLARRRDAALRALLTVKTEEKL